MPSGRRPKPEGLKKAQGNPGKKRKPKAVSPVEFAAQAHAEAAIQAPDVFAPPASLGEPERKVWEQLVPLLAARKFVQATDVRTFSRYCKFLALFEAIAPKVDDATIVVTTSSEHVTMDRLSKHFLALVMLDKRLEAMEDRFGLSPQARQSLLLRRAAAGPGGLFPSEPEAKSEPKPESKEAPPPSPAQKPPSPIGLGRSTLQ